MGGQGTVSGEQCTDGGGGVICGNTGRHFQFFIFNFQFVKLGAKIEKIFT